MKRGVQIYLANGVRLLALLCAAFMVAASPGVASAKRGKSSKSKPKPKSKAKAKKPPAETPEEESGCKAPFPLERQSPAMRKELEKKIRAAGYGRYLDKQSLAVSLVDISRPGRVFYAGINDDKMLYAASMPKIAILLSVVEAVNEGRLQWDHEYDKRLQNMIVASSNSDASWGVDMVGLLAIEDTMRSPKYCFYEEPEGGLWVGRAYRGGGGTNRDPLFNISHGATSRQAARFYLLLEAGKLVSEHWSFRMLGLMSPPKHHHKFVGGLSKEPGVVFLARKSGTWRTFHADSALIQQGDRKYIATAMADSRGGEQMMRTIIRIMHSVIVDGEHRKGRRGRQARR